MKKLKETSFLGKWSVYLLIACSGTIFGIYVSETYIRATSGWTLLPLIQASGPLAILLSVMFASRQFVYNRWWNKKDAANRALYGSQKNISSYMGILGKYYDVRQCFRNKITIPIVDIHNIMGVFVFDRKDNEGNELYRFVFNGSTVNDEDIRNIHGKEWTPYRRSFERNINGREFERSLLALLNEYEYICLSTRKEIFDYETVVELIGPSIASAYIVFHDYIMHLRTDARHGEKRYSTYQEIENMYSSIRGFKNNVFNLPPLSSPREDTEEGRERYRVPFRMHPAAGTREQEWSSDAPS